MSITKIRLLGALATIHMNQLETAEKGTCKKRASVRTAMCVRSPQQI